MYGAGDVRVENVPDPVLNEPTDALVRVLQSCICGSDLWPYASLPTSDHGRRMGHEFLGVGQGEAVRVPQAQGTLVTVDVTEDAALLPSLLTLSGVFCTGHHAAVTAGVTPRTTVIGDGAVGLSAVLAAKRLGAERIILMGRHTTAPTWAASSAPRTWSRRASRRCAR
jgi:threonine dehydrogenase-like Zn-dependent dehydrogenase